MTAEIRPARPEETGPALTATARRVGVNVTGGSVESRPTLPDGSVDWAVFNNLPAFPSRQRLPDPIDTPRLAS
ncbi:MAG: hypothetical protein V3V82_07000 [Acidimicrobiia bacterium]